MKVEPIVYEDRKVYSVPAFSRGIAMWLGRLPDVWVEGEVTELRRSPAWQRVFLTLKDPESGATLSVTMRRDRFDALELELADGERVHVHGRAELYEARGELSFKALTIERFGIGVYQHSQPVLEARALNRQVQLQHAQFPAQWNLFARGNGQGCT